MARYFTWIVFACFLFTVFSYICIFLSLHKRNSQNMAPAPYCKEKLSSAKSNAFLFGDERSDLNRCDQQARLAFIRQQCEDGCVDRPVRLERQIRTGVALKMPIITDDRHGVLFCPILKAASTSFLRLMANWTGTLPRGASVHDRDVIHAAGLKYLAEYTLAGIGHRLDGYFKFIAVRHPFDRLLSAYVDKFAGSAPLHNYLPRYEALVRRHFGGRLSTNPDGEQIINVTQFLTLIAEDPQEFRNPHWATYVSSCQPCLIQYDHVIRMESFHDDVSVVLDRLRERADVAPDLPKHGIHRSTAVRERFQEITRVFRELSQSTTDKLLELYKWDFKIFGYTWDYNTGPGCLHHNTKGQCC